MRTGRAGNHACIRYYCHIPYHTLKTGPIQDIPHQPPAEAVEEMDGRSGLRRQAMQRSVDAGRQIAGVATGDPLLVLERIGKDDGHTTLSS